MKFLVVASAVLIISAVNQAELSDSEKEKFISYKNECQKSSGVEQHEIDLAKVGQFENEPKLKEYLFCIAKKHDCLNDDGELKIDVIRGILTDAVEAGEADRIVKVCVGRPLSTAQETSFQLAKCFYEESHHHFSFIDA